MRAVHPKWAINWTWCPATDSVSHPKLDNVLIFYIFNVVYVDHKSIINKVLPKPTILFKNKNIEEKMNHERLEKEFLINLKNTLLGNNADNFDIKNASV